MAATPSKTRRNSTGDIAVNDWLIAESAEIYYADCVINETTSVLVRRLREQKRQGEVVKLLDEIERLFPASALTWTYPGIVDEWAAVLGIIRESGGKLNFHDALLARTAISLSVDRIVSFDASLDAISFWDRISEPA